MTINDYINIISFAVVLLSTGITIGRFIEKISIFIQQNKSDRQK